MARFCVTQLHVHQCLVRAKLCDSHLAAFHTPCCTHVTWVIRDHQGTWPTVSVSGEQSNPYLDGQICLERSKADEFGFYSISMPVAIPQRTPRFYS